MNAPVMGASCPVPITETSRVLLGHGSGGRLTAKLIEELILPALRNPLLEPLDDASILSPPAGRIAFTTDSYVVTPLFFAGGDIGELAVNGTVNDLAVSGARPLALSLAFILEEGLPLADLERIVGSVARAAKVAGVSIATGDTKVVGRGCADKIFINTSGVGVVPPGVDLSARNVRPGDAMLLSGPSATMASRSSRAARGSNSTGRWRATPRPSMASWHRFWRAARACTPCATRPAEGSRPHW